MNFIYINTEYKYMKISERGQLTLPKALRNKFGLHKDVEVDLIPVKNGILIQKYTRSMHPVDKVVGILNRPSDTDNYIKKIRGV